MTATASDSKNDFVIETVQKRSSKFHNNAQANEQILLAPPLSLPSNTSQPLDTEIQPLF